MAHQRGGLHPPGVAALFLRSLAFRAVSRRVRVLSAVVLVASLAGCDGGEEEISQDQIRDCLAGEARAPREGSDTTVAVLGSVSPDFRVTLSSGTAVDFVVEGTEEKARRKAADIRGALQSFGVATQQRLLIGRNVIAVFERPPSTEDRDRVAKCLD
jgi:hypothetical protein